MVFPFLPTMHATNYYYFLPLFLFVFFMHAWIIINAPYVVTFMYVAAWLEQLDYLPITVGSLQFVVRYILLTLILPLPLNLYSVYFVVIYLRCYLAFDVIVILWWCRWRLLLPAFVTLRCVERCTLMPLLPCYCYC